MAFDHWCWGVGICSFQVGVDQSTHKKKGSVMADMSRTGFGAIGSDGQPLPSVDWSKLVPTGGEYAGGMRAKFLAEVVAVSARLNINPNWLLFTMYRESSFRAGVKNPNSTAVGLIQFIESTAKSLGTTTAKLRQMTPLEQLKYVEAYYRPYKGRLNSFFDLYLATFYPAVLGKSDSTPLGGTATAQARIARVNKAYDTNKDGKLTVGELRKRFDSYWIKGVSLTKDK